MNRRVLLLGALGAATGCRSSTGPVESLQLSLVASSSVITADAPAFITITATNRGRRAVTIDTNPCPERFVVRSVAGAVVGPPGQLCLAYLAPHSLEPGEQWIFRTTWAGQGSSASLGGPAEQLPAGVYRLIGVVAGGAGLSYSTPVSVRVQ